LNPVAVVEEGEEAVLLHNIMKKVPLKYVRANVHVGIMKGTLREVRLSLLKEGLSLQSFFSYMAELVTLYDPRIMELVEELKELKENKELAKLSEIDTEQLYNILDRISPFGDEKQTK